MPSNCASLSPTPARAYTSIPFDATQNSDSLSVISSEYRSRNLAVYGQLDGNFNERARWSLGLRGERHTSRYNDVTTNLDAPSTANNFGPSDHLWGGQASIDYRIADGENLYALIARGYKASGFNLSPGLPANQLQFGPESDLNLEVGHKAALDDGRLQIDTSLFYMVRQRTTSSCSPASSWIPAIRTLLFSLPANAKSGFNYGLESTANWAATRSLTLGGSLGLLQTQYRGFVQNGVTLPDRALPHAAPWQAALNATWRDPRGPYARLDITGMGTVLLRSAAE